MARRDSELDFFPLGIDLVQLVTTCGLTGRFVREYCKQAGWSWTRQGAPYQWFNAWNNGLGRAVAKILEGRSA